MKSRILPAVMATALICFQAATGQATQAPETEAGELGWLLGDTEPRPAPYNAERSKTYPEMKRDADQMQEVMQKTVALAKLRIEVARKGKTVMCISCMEEELNWIQREVDSASWWNTILLNPNNQPLDHLEAFWAIQDAYKNVKNMKEKMDRSWAWRITAE